MKYDSHEEARMAELAIAANEYKAFVMQVFQKHGQQIVPVLIMVAGNATMCAESEGKKLATDSISSEQINELMLVAKMVAAGGPTVIGAFLYLLGAEVSDQVKLSELKRQIDNIDTKGDA